MAEIVVSMASKQAEELVGKLVDKLYATISGELSLLLGVRGEIKYIRDELELMSAFLRGAEEIQDKDLIAMAWVKQVKELAYAAEDCIDEFSLHLLRRRHNTNLAAALWQRAGSLCSLGARRRIAAKIQSIRTEVEEVSNRRFRYMINHKPSSSNYDIVNQHYDPRSAALFVEDLQLVGIEKPRDDLIRLLKEGNSNLSLIAVVGLGGSGKTTLAKKVFDSSAITMHFPHHAWITVAQNHPRQLVRTMIRELIPSPPNDLDKKERVELITLLKEHLKDKRYLFVFDDIWEVEVWKSLQDTLPQNDSFSRIIITTRNFEVAKNCVSSVGHGHIHEQKALSKEQSMVLFCRRLSLDLGTCSDELKSLSERFLQKCDGLPLAIVATSAALAGKTSGEWEKMLGHLSAELESNPNLQGVMQVLNLSYIDLPYHVKRCFLYLAKFPEDTEINCNRIRRLWVAEGLVSSHRGMTAEEVAESYLNVLVNRCLILPCAFSINGRVKRFKIHDMMLEMIVSKSIQENFLAPLLQKESTWTPPQEMIRRLSISNEHIPEDMTRLRSLTVFGDCGPSFFSKYPRPAFRLLRVFELEDCMSFKNKHFEVICQHLFHLKYLSLRRTGVRRLPSSIRNLCNLETLCIRDGYDIRSSPKKIYRLERLRFLSIRYIYLNISHCKFMPNSGRLRNLQELGDVIISDRRVMKELQKLNQLRKLKIVLKEELGESGIRDFCVWLENLSSTLRSLTVEVRHPSQNISFLNELKSPPLKLESLTLVGHLGTLPDWISRLGNLVKLILKWSDIEEEDGFIQTLGRLSNLLKLQLFQFAYMGERLCFGAQSGFPCLKELSLGNMENLRRVIFEQGALQCVASVSMVRNSVENGSLEISGIENLCNLKEFRLKTTDSTAGERVKQAIDAHPNHPRLSLEYYNP